MITFTKEDLIEKIHQISREGWKKSVKQTIERRNDGAVGNTLECLLGLSENNLPIPNAQEWELKGQREHTSSLITLKHLEPSPTALQIVSCILLPNFGWRHKEAGKKYPNDEKSFRSTTDAIHYTNRGFKLVLDRNARKLRFTFSKDHIDASDPSIKEWANSVPDSLCPEPYWGFQDLEYAIGSKIKNCFYVIAESKIENRHEFFLYKKLFVLSGFDFERFLNCIEMGLVFVDFDARTGHNHGTKFRIKQNSWKNLYKSVQEINLLEE
ncbi:MULTISPECIES: MvaI/BcnI restriction endonuclease family protein [Anaerolinea]|uniref:MvaI/BcnI restriction endonuclease domain-containing protein n=1 Tax=Anaerolinea thermophila (strain DSM 14523 / JCM 11388 / NBRC 100420 / UNI-1) TaxID=926569 RepID=E8MZ19_ANATU|nr:MvaI/BcnI restriction endonuclease family protein [Anaerolinea thermophila]BAJ62162.1 hypothetical protein ANT_01280 [Anaerolinea thermophila UNI-1]